MRKFIGNLAAFVCVVCTLIILFGALFTSPRVMAPDSLRRVQLEGITQAQADIALTVSEVTLNDSESGVNYTRQYKTLAEAGQMVALAFYTVAISLACLSVPACAFFVITKGFSTDMMYGNVK